MKVLLHTCCAPCTIYPLQTLREEGAEVCGFFYNPNIHPFQEYKKRLDTLKTFADQVHLQVLWQEDYPIEEFLRPVAFHEGERCQICYELRLGWAAKTAGEGGFDAFTTTLLYSRFQRHDMIRGIGQRVSEKYGVPFLYRDFRQGWSEGIRMSKEMSMYRQPYCGCIFSERERYGSTKAREEMADEVPR